MHRIDLSKGTFPVVVSLGSGDAAAGGHAQTNSVTLDGSQIELAIDEVLVPGGPQNLWQWRVSVDTGHHSVQPNYRLDIDVRLQHKGKTIEKRARLVPILDDKGDLSGFQILF